MMSSENDISSSMSEVELMSSSAASHPKDDNRHERKSFKDHKPYTPYESTVYETPLVSFLAEPILPFVDPILRVFFRIRWFVATPLNTHVLPKSFPLICIPGLRFVPYVTVGEVLLTLPLIAILVVSVYKTFVDPQVSGSGSVAAWPIYATFLTANKTNSLFSFVFGVPFERMLGWHLLCALLSIVTGCFHYYVAYAHPDEGSDDRRELFSVTAVTDDVFSSSPFADHTTADQSLPWNEDFRRDLSGDESEYSLKGPNPDFVKFSFDGGTNMSGTILVLALISITVLSLFPILRRLCYELFYYSHIILAISILVFGLIHSVGGLVGILIWWLVDLVLRYVIMAGWRYPHRASIRLLPADVIELSFPRPEGFKYNPGQYVQLSVPKLGVLDFHPFSISSAPHQDVVTIHIRVLGRWTRRLADLASEVDSVNILMEGPFGSLSVDLDNDERYKMVLLVSGGIGITPMQSLCNGLVHDHLVRKRAMKKIYFVWTVRDHNIVHALNDGGAGSLPGGDRWSQQQEGTTQEDPRGKVQPRLDNLSFQPDLLTNLGSTPSLSDAREVTKVEAGLPECANDDNNDFLHTEFYLTGEHHRDSGDVVSPYIKLGRPDIDQIFKKMKQAALAEGENRVAVCVCGPRRLTDGCREASRSLSGDGVRFDFHQETFEF